MKENRFQIIETCLNENEEIMISFLKLQKTEASNERLSAPSIVGIMNKMFLELCDHV